MSPITSASGRTALLWSWMSWVRIPSLTPMKAQDLVPHALGLQDVPHAHVVHPRLVTVPQAVRCQPGAQREPGRDRHGLGRLLPRSGTLHTLRLVADDRAVAAQLDREAAGMGARRAC